MKERINQGVSIIVCCFNSVKRLPETIKHIAKQIVPEEIKWEVIIINNASTDNTKEVAQSEWEKYNLTVDFTIIEQPVPGLKAAREKGIEISKYEYLLFCDDDNWLMNNYTHTAYEIMSSYPEIGILGGYSEAVFEEEPPKWFHEHKFGYAVGKQAEISGEIKGSVYGAGMVLRKSAWIRLLDHGFKFTLSGRKGKKLTAGEDCEMCYAIRLMKFKIFYDERLVLKHFMPASRITWRVFRKMYRGFGIQNAVLYPYQYVINGNNEENGFMLSWKKRIFDTIIWFLKNPKLVFKTFLIEGEGDIGILSTERKIGLLIGLLKRKSDYDKSFFDIKTFAESYYKK